MPTHESTFEVDAAPDRVWEVLTDLARYQAWNPQIVEASGSTEPGCEITLALSLSNGPNMTVTALIEEIEPGRSLTWRGNGARQWVFSRKRHTLYATG